MSNNSNPDNFLTAKIWEATYGESFEKWRKDRWSTSSRETRVFLEHLLPLGRMENEKRLLPHQSEALQRVIYSFEHCKLDPLLVTLATGTGKTVVLASVMAWLACRGSLINTFILFCPNTIVRDRLKRDFERLEVFNEFNLFPNEFKDRLKGLSCSIIEGFENFSNLIGKNLLVANRHQFQIGYSGGNDHMAFIQREGGKLAVFNDEAHNTRGKEYSRSLSILKSQTKFRLDVTATPDRADNLRPQSHEIYNLSVVEAITGSYRSNRFIDPYFKHYPPLIKDVVVLRPSPKKYYAIQLDELTFTDVSTNKSYNVREIDWDELIKKKNLQLVMDPGPMKLQLSLAYEAYLTKKEISKGRFKPLLFVIAPSIAGAHKAVDMMRSEFKLNPLLVVGELEDSEDIPFSDKESLRKAAAELGDTSSQYDSVVSVYMLREGWDVPEVSVMCLLRGFGSPLFAHQVLGRGLRLIRKNGLEKDRSIQELTVIDHQCLQLDDLWIEIDALVKEEDKIVREHEISRDGTAEIELGEDEVYEEQVMVRQNLFDFLLPIPSPKSIHALTTERVLDMLTESLTKLKDFKNEQILITGAEIEGVEKLRVNKPGQKIEKTLRVDAIPGSDKEREFAQKEFNKGLMDWAEDYCEKFSPLTTHDDLVYKKILKSFEDHIFMGRHSTDVQSQVLFYALQVIQQLREAVTFELNHKIYSEEVLLNE